MTQELKDQISAVPIESVMLMARIKAKDTPFLVKFLKTGECFYFDDFLHGSRCALAREYGAVFHAAAIRRLMSVPCMPAKWQGWHGGYAEKRGNP